MCRVWVGHRERTGRSYQDGLPPALTLASLSIACFCTVHKSEQACPQGVLLRITEPQWQQMRPQSKTSARLEKQTVSEAGVQLVVLAQIVVCWSGQKRQRQRALAGNMYLKVWFHVTCQGWYTFGMWVHECESSVCIGGLKRGQHFAKSPSSEEHVWASVSDLSPARQWGQASAEPLGGRWLSAAVCQLYLTPKKKTSPNTCAVR